MTPVRIIRPSEGLSPELGAAISDLTSLVWPPDPTAPVPDREKELKKDLETWRARESTHCVVMGAEGSSEVLAHALIFRREIFTEQGTIPVGALAMVCVHPDYRGHGWGADVVRAAFEMMPELDTPVSLFQSPVPQFYEKLGARIVTNRFFNGQTPDNPGNPFWDTVEMIYPATFPWPAGDIDLNGEGY